MEWLPAEAHVDPDRLIRRLRFYAQRHNVQESTLHELMDLLHSPTVTELFRLPISVWADCLVNDCYKATMHHMYAAFMPGVSAEFALHVRRSPISLQTIGEQHPELFNALAAQVQHLRSVQPYSVAVQRALQTHLPDFSLSKEMLGRAEAYGVAPIAWSLGCGDIASTASDLHSLAPASAPDGDAAAQDATSGSSCSSKDMDVPAFLEQVTQECASGEIQPWHACMQDGSCGCIAAGPVEAASHTETSVMQLVQHAVVTAQVYNIRQQLQQQGAQPTWPDRTEMLAASLAHLATVVDKLNGSPHGLKIALFAGRRASDRLYLVLQNLAFARMVKGYSGTSSIYAAVILAKVWDKLGVPPSDRFAQLGPLVGTHAHEMSSIAQQLLSDIDARAGADSAKVTNQDINKPGRLVITSVLAHLLFLANSGDLEHATALPDTFGTPAWLAVALAAEVPAAFIQYMQRVHGKTVRDGAKVFDLFRVWRIDSGNYGTMAEMIVSAWEQRCKAVAESIASQAPISNGIGSMSTSKAAENSSTSSGATAEHGVNVPFTATTPEARGTPMPRPILMHSNLSSVDEVLQFAKLPERIRPNFAAFGTLADGFVPLVPEDATQTGEHQQEYEIGMASVVMKAVQARAPKVDVTQISALKMGDENGPASAGKMEVDPRLHGTALEAMRELGLSMRHPPAHIDEKVVSAALAEAFQLVTQEAILGM